MWVSNEELEMLGIRYVANKELQSKFETFAEYVLNYVNTENEKGDC